MHYITPWTRWPNSIPGAHAGRRDQAERLIAAMEALAQTHGVRERCLPAGAAGASQGGGEGLAPHAEQQLMSDGRGSALRQAAGGQPGRVHRALYDFATRHVYPANNPSSAERLSLVAVGGYGRGTLAPGSDIDLLLLLPYKQTAWSESVVEWILYVLWDLGLKVGHATRRIDDTIRLADRHHHSHLADRGALRVRRPGAVRRA
jgi:[protein-PII] uridylyltransferase